MTLSATSTCTIVLGFAPTTSGSYSNTFSLSAYDGVSTVNVAKGITGIAITPALLTLTNIPTYDFGAQQVGSTTDRTFTLTNSGGSTATALATSGLSAPLNFRGGSYPGTGGNCGTTLAASATCTLVVRFAPTAAGALTETLNLTYNDGTGSISTSLGITGSSYFKALLAVTAPVANPYTFASGTIGAAQMTASFIVTNSGNGSASSLTSMNLSSPFSYVGGTYPGTSGTCGTNLSVSASCTVNIGFLPSSPGTFNSGFTLIYLDGSGASVSLTQPVTGTAVNPALLSISDGPIYDFGSHTTGTNTDQSLVLTNTGGTNATSITASSFSGPFNFKGGTYPGTGGNCGSSLGAGSSCSVVVRFSPTSVGGFNSILTMSYSDGAASATTNRSITGTGGTVANLIISGGPTFDFGVLSRTYFVEQIFTVTNSGSAAATGLSASTVNAPFSFKGGTYPGTGGNCGTSIGAGGSCALILRFTPTSIAASSDTLTLNYDNASIVTTSTRALSGTGASILKIVGGTDHTCALYSTGIIRCWGSNVSGQLGNAAAGTSSTSPVLVVGITNATDIAAGSDHTCAVLSNGRAQCWGSDSSGQIGNDTTLSNVQAPSLVATYTDFSKIAAGGRVTCGLRTGGTIVCWGDDTEGANGNDAAFTNNPTPVTVAGLTGMSNVSVGRATACARKSDGTVRCWGSDSDQQLGNGGLATNSGIPVTPSGGVSTVVSTANGGNSSCAILTGGTVRCWGANTDGQLGDGNSPTARTTGATITNLANFSKIILGARHGCGVNASNGVSCFGYNFFGQLGDSSTTSRDIPAVVTGISSGVSILGVGENHSCAVLATGAGYCWGANSSGQLGSTPLSSQSTPVLIPSL